jgi:hypothetical protein
MILATLAPESILVTLTSGQMFRQGSALTDAERTVNGVKAKGGATPPHQGGAQRSR